mmetsp:Transcript_39954/g.105708  ORF Transcript_39954/g.105708 Transcript_39954/m.105708 type:complete len:305 (-) Transcript_39954:871-1785(-)
MSWTVHLVTLAKTLVGVSAADCRLGCLRGADAVRTDGAVVASLRAEVPHVSAHRGVAAVGLGHGARGGASVRVLEERADALVQVHAGQGPLSVALVHPAELDHVLRRHALPLSNLRVVRAAPAHLRQRVHACVHGVVHDGVVVVGTFRVRMRVRQILGLVVLRRQRRPIDGDVATPVGPCLLVAHAQGVQQFVDHVSRLLLGIAPAEVDFRVTACASRVADDVREAAVQVAAEEDLVGGVVEDGDPREAQAGHGRDGVDGLPEHQLCLLRDGVGDGDGNSRFCKKGPDRPRPTGRTPVGVAPFV